MNWISIVLLLGAVQGLFLALVLAGAPNGNRRANPWLAAFVAAFALLTVGDVMQESALVLRYPHTALVFDWLLLLIGPLMLFYVRALIGVPVRARAFLLHAVPALVLGLWMFTFHLLPQAEMLHAIEQDRASNGGLNLLVALAMLQTLAYWVWGVVMLRRHMQRMKGRYSDIAQRGFNWLTTLLTFNLVLWLLWVLTLTTDAGFARTVSNLAFPLGAYVVGYRALRQPQVFFEPASDEADVIDPLGSQSSKGAAKYAKSRLDAARAQEIAVQLERVMADAKPYLQNDLTLTELARQVNVSAHHLSQVFSESIGTSFFDFINTRRVDEVKRRLADPRAARTSILDIAFAAGFNSKAAFNVAFRRYAGVTPSAFRRTLPVNY